MIQLKQFIYFLLLISFSGHAQGKYTIKGNLLQAKNTELELVGFSALKDTVIAKVKSDSIGNFNLSYPASYIGAAVLELRDKNSQKSNNSIVLLLNKENFSINWADFENPKSLNFENSYENDTFFKGMTLYQQSESILAGLKYLKPLYQKSPKELQWLTKEIKVQESVLPNMLKKLPSANYAGYYLFIRKFIADMPATANRYGERLPETENQFKAIDFTDERLLRSGLLKEVLNSYYKLMESWLDEMPAHANAATDALLKSLNSNIVLKQEVAAYLFEYLEKRSSFKSAEYLALAMLNDSSCSLDKKSIGLYEQYKKMAVGKQAPEIQLSSTGKGVSTLSNISASYKLVVFGSSWCPKCQEEVIELKKHYQEWKERYNLEVVFVSLDTDTEKYNAFIKDFPWISSCDFKGQETQSAIDYHVFATPTLYLLDSTGKIILKPFSAGHVNSWIRTYSVK